MTAASADRIPGNKQGVVKSGEMTRPFEPTLPTPIATNKLTMSLSEEKSERTTTRFEAYHWTVSVP